MRLPRFLKRSQSRKQPQVETAVTDAPLLELPEGVLYGILQQLPGNEPLRLTGVSRQLRATVLNCSVVDAQLALICREGDGIVGKRLSGNCTTRSFLKFLHRGGAGALASLSIAVNDAKLAASGLLNSHAPVTAAAWEPLAALRTLSLTLPRSLSRESTDDLVRACGSLRTLTLQYPAGSVDTSYLMRHVEHMGSLQRLEVTAQRVLFSAGFGGGAGGKARPLQLVFRVQELALYGGGRLALAAYVEQVELHVQKMIHFEGAAALRRLLDSGDRLSLHCASDDVFQPFGDRRHIIGADVVEEEELIMQVATTCKPLAQPTTSQSCPC